MGNEIQVRADLKENSVEAMKSPIPASESLAKHTRNLTLDAKRGRLPPAYGRDIETENMMSILCAIESNNPLLIGPAGCGKTRIAEGLAYKIAFEKVPTSLHDKQVLLLDLSKLLGGTKHRGELEEKISEFLESVMKYEDTFILIIDEIHRIVGVGGSEGSNYNISNEFKEVLARGKMRTVGMTTTGESQILKSDEALKRRFTEQSIQTFTPVQTLEVMKRDKEFIEKGYTKSTFCTFSIDEAVLEAASFLAEHYLPEEHLPSSAAKLLNSACGAKARTIMQKNLDIKVTIDDLYGFIESFFIKPTQMGVHTETKSDIEKHFKRLKAESHITNTLIPKSEALIRFTENFTNLALQGLIAPCKYREEPINQMISVLVNRSTNNVIICGEAGVGKTAVVKELARLMSLNKVPKFLKNKLLLSLKLNELLNPSQKSSESLSALTQFIDSAIKYSGKYILFIDEIHLLFQAQINGFSLFELFKPILAEGHIRLIGAITSTEFEACLRSASSLGALTRRFKMLNVGELTIDQTVEILEERREGYESEYSKKFGMTFQINSNVIRPIVIRAKHLPTDSLPDCAIQYFENFCSQKGLMADSFEEEEGSENSPKTVVILAQDIASIPEKSPAKPKRVFSWLFRMTQPLYIIARLFRKLVFFDFFSRT